MPIALAQIVIQLLPSITTGVEQLIAYIHQVRTVTQQTGEWTPDLEAKFRASLIACGKDPAYQP
jgi:hypothetical protein